MLIMNLQDIYEFMDKFEKSSMSEIQLEMDNMKITCKKEQSAYGSNVQSGSTDSGIYKTSADTADTGNAKEIHTDILGTEVQKMSADEICVRAKVAGTFYRAESPDSTPFVQVGQQVKKGDVLGMIEAMKMMNNITSPVDGEVVDIVKGNEELVGYDDALMILKVGTSQ